jgi:Transposase DDE domain/Domain of unknown function (DUF4372)
LAHHCTVLTQILKILPRHEFDGLARRHHQGRALRSTSRWDQFVGLLTGQLTGRSSLRDLVANVNAQTSKLYHLGLRGLTRSTLARVNEQQPASLFEALFHQLLARTQKGGPSHRFRFKGKVFSVDATLIELAASVFPWAGYQATKGAIKLHVGLDHDGYVPAFVHFTEGKTHEIAWARTLELPAGSVVIADRGFFDYDFFNSLSQKKIRFVTRLKRGVRYDVIERREVREATGLTSDQTIRFRGKKAEQYGLELRRIGFRDPQTNHHYVFLTNASGLAATTIAKLYRERWQIELFFKWIKQNLKIKSFLGTSANAVQSQIWVALIAYLLIAYLKFKAQAGVCLTQILRLLQLNLFERRNLHELLTEPGLPPPVRYSRHSQLALELA